jgi:hypothetical protein
MVHAIVIIAYSKVNVVFLCREAWMCCCSDRPQAKCIDGCGTETAG